MTRFRPLPSAIVGLLLSAVLIVPSRGQAADVCCACTQTGETDRTCLRIDSDDLGSETSCTNLPEKASLTNWTCEEAALSTSRCRAVSLGGVCAKGPMTAASAREGDDVTDGGSGQTSTPIPFELNVDIPGFEGDAVSPSLAADYLLVVFRYGISIVAVATTIMFIYGAFMYLLGAAIPSVNKGKSVMKDAVIGMLLLLGSTLILRTLNPNLLNLNPIDPQEIDAEIYNIAAGPLQGTGAAGPPPEGVVAAIIEGARKAKVDPCILLAICEHETGLRPLWNGQLSGTPKENAIAFGVCQVDVRFLHDNNKTVKRAREFYPDFPPESPKAKKFITDKEEKVKRGDWMLTNIEGSAFIAGSVLRSNIAMNGGNELVAVAAYGAGSASLKRWRTANGCSYERGLKISGATSESLNRSCIPHSVGIIIGDNPSSACQEDKYNCRNPKANAKAELIGTCAATGKDCYAMITDMFVSYVMKAYPRMQQAYQCGG